MAEDSGNRDVSKEKSRKASESKSDLKRNSSEYIDPEKIESLPPEQKQLVMQSIAMILSQKTHRGPLPDPETLREYKELITDGANRVMVMAEKQLDHRINMERTVVPEQQSQSRRGQFFALYSFLGCLMFSIIALFLGYSKTAGAVMIFTVVAIATLFITNKQMAMKGVFSREKEEEKEEDPEE